MEGDSVAPHGGPVGDPMADDLEPSEDEIPDYEDIQGEDSAPTEDNVEQVGAYSPTEPASLTPGK
eukprot:3138543-Alexandrium_andersonii.AAC.1